MVKDLWDSFKDNIKERVSNPFLGTFALVWVVHNWSIVYGFFFFDKEWKFENKVAYFNKYWTDNSFIGNLFCVALITIIVLVVTYLFLAISRYLASGFENIIIPHITKWSKGKIVTFETYKIALQKIDDLENKIEVERKLKLEAQDERDRFEKLLYQKNQINSQDTNEKKTEKFVDLIDDLNKSHTKEVVESVIINISKGMSFSKENGIIDYFLKKGIIELDRKGSTSNGIVFYYKFTTLGNEFKRYYL